MARTTTIQGHTFTFGRGVKLCTQCDALVTGVPGGDAEFARCGACTRIMERGFGADHAHPGTGKRTKAMTNHRQLTHDRFTHLAIRAAEHHLLAVNGFFGAFSYQTKRDLAERLIGAPLYATS